MKLFRIPSKILNFRLFTFVAVSLCMGTTSAYFFLLKKLTLGVVICAVFAVSVCAYLFIKVSNGKGFKVKSVFCLVFALFFVIGNLSLTAVISDYERANLGGHYYTVTARIAQNDLTDSGSRLLLDNISISGDFMYIKQLKVMFKFKLK